MGMPFLPVEFVVLVGGENDEKVVMASTANEYSLTDFRFSLSTLKVKNAW